MMLTWAQQEVTLAGFECSKALAVTYASPAWKNLKFQCCSLILFVLPFQSTTRRRRRSLLLEFFHNKAVHESNEGPKLEANVTKLFSPSKRRVIAARAIEHFFWNIFSKSGERKLIIFTRPAKKSHGSRWPVTTGGLELRNIHIRAWLIDIETRGGVKSLIEQLTSLAIDPEHSLRVAHSNRTPTTKRKVSGLRL